MNLKEFIVSSINRSVIEVFSTMLGVELAAGAATYEDPQADINCEVVSLLGLAGSWAGAGSLSCSAGLACRVCNNMLMTDTTAVDEEVLDAMAELTNMIVGNVKTDLETQLGPLGLSIPTVVYGRNFRTKTAVTTDWIALRYLWDDDYLSVKLCLAPKDAHAPVHLIEELDTINV